MELHWYLVPSDGRFPWRPEWRRAAHPSYLRQLATTIEHVGLDGTLVAGGAGGHDLWTFSSFMAAATERIKFIIAQHPGETSPLLLAQQAATFDQFSKGRLIINVVNGSEFQSRGHGIFLSNEERYAYADEYWGVWKRLITGETVDFDGKYVKLKGARLALKPYQQPRPELYFGGSSPAALAVAAKHVDTYLTWGEPPPQAGEKIREVQALAAAQGRKLRFGLRIYVIVRETNEEAWAAAQYLYDRIDKDTVDNTRRIAELSKSTGQERMSALSFRNGELPKDARALEVYPDIWAGIGLTRIGPGTAIVGDPETVAARIREYESYGFDVFILSGYPLLEEAYRFSELVLPLLRKGNNPEASQTNQWVERKQLIDPGARTHLLGANGKGLLA
ncbi:MAG: LLM class flavin-dependent oxidoreductase [Candidatus Methylacidiphilales bacterium]